ncbi:MAG: papain-like cysteine protease family protein [Bacteroidota bacterium]
MKAFIICAICALGISGNGTGEGKAPGKSKTTASSLDCGPYNNYGIQRCVAGINSSILDVRGLDIQNADEWCWAASIQAIFNYYGHNISQARIVQETFGQVVNMPAQPGTILSALNRYWIDDSGVQFMAQANSFSASPITAAQDLASDNPLIIGTMGHAMVLTALEYDHNTYGQGNVVAAVVRDPWPANPRRRVLSPQEWSNTSFLARIRVY